jgi:hypothetical protein
MRSWSFVLGPGFVVGVGNGLDPGLHDVSLRSDAAGPGDIGAHRRPLICITRLLVVLDVIPGGGTVQAIATIPEFICELSLGSIRSSRGSTHLQSSSLPPHDGDHGD